MTCVTVKTQAELDTALAATAASCIHIESEPGIWLRLDNNNGHSVEAWGSSSVVARGSSSVVAWGSSSVEARGSSSVEARGSSSVEARDSSSVEARGSSSVEARDSSSVEARGATRVSARDRSATTASTHVAVHLHSAQARVEGGVLIDLTRLDLSDPAMWCEHHGVRVDDDGRAVLYKAVNKDLTAGQDHGRPTTYAVGSEVTAEDWRDDDRCGGGLHLSPHPGMAGSYERGPAATRRFLRCTVALADWRPISEDKGKARCVRVDAEVDVRGRELETSASA